MSNLSQRMTKTITKLMDKFGAPATVSRRNGGTFDPVLQVTTGGGLITDSVNAVIEEFRAAEVNGDTIRYGDRRVTIPISELTHLSSVVPDDTITVLGNTYRVVSAVGVLAGDAVIGYSVQVRK